MGTGIRYLVSPENEPKAEAWLEKRGIQFEVGVARRGGKLAVSADFGAIENLKERARLEAMYADLIKRLNGGKNK